MTTRALPPMAPEPAPHGGPRGGHYDSHVRIDLSTNVNPYGPPPIVLTQARAADLTAYPDPSSLRAREAAASRWQRPIDELAFGAGVSELLPALFSGQATRGDAVVVAAPLYGEYARTTALVGGRLVAVARRSSVPRTARMLAAMRRFAPRIVVVVAPGNPRGEAWTVDELTQLADAAHERRCLLVIDQSYNAFLDRPLGDPALPGHPAVLHLRSLTKDFAIAGLRAAFAIGPAAVIRALEARRAPWSASAPAQAAAVACCEPEAQQHVVATTRALRRDAADFARSLREAGIGVHETQVHWVLCSLSTAQAHRLEHQHGIRVRTLDDHLLTGLARIVAPVSQQRTEVVHAIAAVHRTPIAPLTDSEPS